MISAPDGDGMTTIPAVMDDVIICPDQPFPTLVIANDVMAAVLLDNLPPHQAILTTGSDLVCMGWSINNIECKIQVRFIHAARGGEPEAWLTKLHRRCLVYTTQRLVDEPKQSPYSSALAIS